MKELAYVTDLHLTPNSPRTASLVDCVRRLPQMGARTLVLGGDLISLPGSLEIGGRGAWDILKESPVSACAYKAMYDYSKDLADEVIPQVIAAASGLSMLSVCGNADYIGYRHISSVYAPFFGF